MDFFGHQDQARKRTKQLIVLFGLALLTLIFLTNLLVAAFLWGNPDIFPNAGKNIHNTSLLDIFHYMSWESWFTISAVICGFVGLAYLYKSIKLSGGGASIARSLGGRLLHPDTQDFYERRLLNIIEEMAIASGMPVPQVYLMDDEIGINAFAAGFQPSDAVIGVTKGCLTKLSRLQLQGVIGHEFSHILNGDMRLNMRLIAILFGILCIGLLGRFLIRAGAGHGSRRSSKNDNAMPLFMIGLGFMVLGYSGVFFGKLIQSAVSRQREFLADASAVQFTRNPQAISQALKVIGHGGVGSAIGHSRREEFSHAFFGNAINHHFSFRPAFLSTHPKLEDRIRRIDKRWDGQWVKPQTLKQAYAESPELAPKNKIRTEELLTGVAAAMTAAIDYIPSNEAKDKHDEVDVDTSNETEVDIEQQLTVAAHSPITARALCYGLILAPNTSLVHEQQLDLIAQFCGDDLRQKVLRLAELILQLKDEHRLELVEKSVPALKLLTPEKYEEFKNLLIKLVQADGKIDLFEWCLYRMLLQYLNPVFGKAKAIKAKHGNADKVQAEIETVLSFVANHGHDSLETAIAGFNAGANAAGFDEISLQPRTESFKSFNVALDTLTQAYPHVKGRTMKALAACVQAHGVAVAEKELVQTIAAILECPTPDLFA